jgi:hypothetical protein
MSTEEANIIDIDELSDEQLDSFLEETTGVDSNWDNLDTIEDKEPTEEKEPVVEDVPEENEEPTDEVTEDAGEDEPTDEELEEGNIDENQANDVLPLDNYTAEELETMTKAYDELFKEGIKAKGTNRTVRDIDHLKALVQLGFGASENNRMIKDLKKPILSLKKAGIDLNEDNINFIVDVMNGNQEAVKDLLFNKAKIDEETLASWLEKGEGTKANYTPTKNHVIPDNEVRLHQVVEEIANTPSFARTDAFIESIDDVGKSFVVQHPEVLKLLNDDISSGNFDKAMEEVQYRMDRGLLPEQSILLNYIKVMQDEDFYNSLQGSADGGSNNTTANNSTTVDKNKEEVVNTKKKVSTTPKVVTPSKGAKNKKTMTVDSLSDDELDKFLEELDVL